MKTLKTFENFGFDWQHEIEMTTSIKKWFTDNNIGYPIEIKGTTDNEFKTKDNRIFILNDEVDNKYSLHQVVMDIPSDYIDEVEINNYKDKRIVDVGVGTPRNEVDDYLTEINDYLYSLSEKEINLIKANHSASKFKI